MKKSNGILSCITDSDIPSNGKFVIPEGITKIGNSAFYNCKSLKSVIIPNSVTEIGNYAFSSCSSLKSVKLSNKIKNINESTFSYCESLKSISIPSSVTSIGYSAFSHCNALKSVTIPDSVTYIGTSAFENCTSLESVTISSSVTSIRKYAFWACTSLTSITIPNSVTYIGEYVFFECTSLTSVNDLPCKYVDSIPMIITSQKKVSEYMIYHGYNTEYINSKDKYYFYVAEKDGFTAHGETAKKAIEDLNFKIARDKLAKEPIYMNTVMTINHYRAITGACSFGVNQWMKQRGIKEEDKLTVKQLLPILKKTNAYGYEKFKSLIKDN